MTATERQHQCLDLINTLLPFAEEMLAEHGEFYPLGATMRPDGTIERFGVLGEDEHPRPSDQVSQLRASFLSLGRQGRLRAAAIAYDVSVTEADGSRRDAIAVDLDHRDDGYAATIYFPYRVVDGEVMLDDPVPQEKAAPPIFGNGGSA